MTSARVVPEELDRQLRTWDRMAFRLRVASVVLGLVAIVCSILVASDIGNLDDGWRRGLAVATAIATALLSGLDLTGKSNSTRDAWRLLNAARLRYCERVVADDQQAMAALIDAYEQAEARIGSITVAV